jgi:hypothetical protein
MAIVSYMFVGILVECPLFLSDLNQTWIFSENFQKNTPASNFLKIRPGGAKLFHVDRQLDEHDKANSHFP